MLDIDGGTTGPFTNCSVYLPNPGNTAHYPDIIAYSYGQSWRGGKADALAHGWVTTLESYNAVKICASAGTWSGTIKIIGIKS
jgi:hypothetical protein